MSSSKPVTYHFRVVSRKHPDFCLITTLISLTALLSALLVSPSMAAIDAPQSNSTSVPENISSLEILEGSDSGGAWRTFLRVGHGSAKERYCQGIADPDCADQAMGVAAYLIPCSSLATVGCIEEVYAIDANANRVDAVYLQTFGEDRFFDYDEIAEKKLVAGKGVGGIWSIPGLTHSGGTDIYAVQARISGGGLGERDTFHYDGAQFTISPVSEKVNSTGGPSGGRNPAGEEYAYTGNNFSCVYTRGNVCFERERMPKDVRFGMKVRVPNNVASWFHGRVSRPEFNIKENQDGTFSYLIEASPVAVPIISKEIPQSSWTSEFYSYVKSRWPMSHGGSAILPGSSGTLAMELAKRFLPMMNDKASQTSDFWVIRTLSPFANGGIIESVDPRINECSQSATVVSGIVTTNASVYSAGPPSFNPVESSLDYQVLSPHFDEEGRENVGSYDLLVNSNVARCIYKFSSAPIKASIEVLGEDGLSKVISTVLGERNGWLYLSAGGFTYSQPTVRVKLIQLEVAKPEAAGPTASSTGEITTKESTVNAGSEFKNKRKKMTVKCIRGKNSKIVTAAKPKCPRGFKKI